MHRLIILEGFIEILLIRDFKDLKIMEMEIKVINKCKITHFKPKKAYLAPHLNQPPLS